MQQFSKYLPMGLFLAFFMFGLAAFMESKPSPKNERIYKMVQKYSPYYLEKRFGGLEIMKRGDPDFKEKPDNTTLFKTFERFERQWGQRHLKIENRTLLILDDNGTVQTRLPLEKSEELHFLQRYYGVRP